MEKPKLDSKKPAEPSSENSRPNSETRLLDDALNLWIELRELSYTHFHLAALETQRAGVSLVTMMIAGIMLGVLLNVIWFGLMAVVVVGLTENGVTLNNAFLLAIDISLLLVLILIGIIRRASYYLKYPVISDNLKSTSNR